MATVEIHLREYERLRRKGVTAHDRGEPESARRAWLRAATHLYEAAARTDGELRASRIRTAEELVRHAKSVDGHDAGNGDRNERAMDDADERGRTEFLPAEIPALGFRDVAGHDDAKRALRLRVIEPVQHRDLAERFGVGVGGGVLLYGPPGTGKTLLARAVAGESGCAFFSIRPSEILSKWVGDAERNIARLFEVARASSPSIIFIDEIDALCPDRDHDTSSVMSRLVPQILAELDGFDSKDGGLLFLGATNVPWRLDAAILRPGRFDDRVHVGLPDFVARRRLFEIELTRRPHSRDVKADKLAERTAGFSGADVSAVVRTASEMAFLDAIGNSAIAAIDSSHLEGALEAVTPSVDPCSLDRFEQFGSAARSGAA